MRALTTGAVEVISEAIVLRECREVAAVVPEEEGEVSREVAAVAEEEVGGADECAPNLLIQAHLLGVSAPLKISGSSP